MIGPQKLNLTTRTHQALSYAHDIADRLGHDEVTSTHVALGILMEGKNRAVGILELLTEVLLTCSETNAASIRTIVRNGGVFDSKEYLGEQERTLLRYWITL